MHWNQRRRISPSSIMPPSPIRLVDTHCHLDWDKFDADREEIIRRAIDAGVTRMVTVGVSVASSRMAIELADQYEPVYAAVGVHPNDAGGFDGNSLSEIRALAQHPKVVAIGEIGLDNYWQTVTQEAQSSAFEAQLDLALDIAKPVIIHSRSAIDEVMSVLAHRFTQHATRSTGILHAFSGNLSAAQRAFECGFLIGVGGPVTFKRSESLRELVRSAPLDRVMIETDAPFLTPEPRRGRRNEPACVRLVAERIALERRASVEEIAEQTTANAARLFGWTSDYDTATP
ncbi:MAG TPA: TatD family hydrolase [Anaerolineae bacterium]|nr:TatD family hydrolase [Anaerolineae bacterium]